MTGKDIVITGMGAVCSAGDSPDALWEAIRSGRSGLGALTVFDSPRCGLFPVGEVKGNPAAASGLSAGSRSAHLAAIAARQACDAAGLSRGGFVAREDVGVILGTSTGGMRTSEEVLRGVVKEGRFDAAPLAHHECAAVTETVAGLLGLGGPLATVSTACTSGALALAGGFDLLCADDAAVLLAGGADSLTRLTLNGFASLLVMSDDGPRPFDAGRRGMSLGEGAAFVVMETLESARSRGARVMARLLGFGLTCDAYHASAPDPEGRGIGRAMKRALDMAGLSPGDVDYINAHGTGTIQNDLAEAKAIRRLFGEKTPPVSSTKRYFGHALAASGALEAVVSVLAMQHGSIPPNLGLREKDPSIGFTPVTEFSRAELRVVMSNSLGFGGNNACLLFAAAGEQESYS